jgi:4-amino-4-deoxy-L-arabinose transferase-like glycosyltransferase
MAIVAAMRFHTRSEPLERDMPTYAVVAHELLGGRYLYSDVFDQKPPAVYATYAVAEKVFGYGQPAVIYLGVAAAWITLFGVFFAARGLCGSSNLGLAAAGAWVVIGSDLALQANQPNTEVFMNACLVWAIAIITHYYPEPPGPLASLGVDLLTTLATLYKPVVVAVPLCVCIGAAVCCFIERNRIQARAAVISVAVMCGVVVASWLLVGLFFRLENHFDAFYYAMVTYNRSYARSVTHNLFSSFEPRKIFPGGSQLWMFSALVIMAICAWHDKFRRRGWLILFSYAAGTHIAVALPGRSFAHYYQLWLPVIAIGFSYILASIQSWTDSTHRRLVIALIVGLSIYVCGREAINYNLSADAWSRQKYGDEFIDARWVGLHINQWLMPGETYYDAGTDPQFYFYSKRRILSGVFYSEALIDKPRAQAFVLRVLADLQTHPPDLVTTDNRADRTQPDVQKWLDAEYARVRVSGRDQYFSYYLRRGSPAEARWRANSIN